MPAASVQSRIHAFESLANGKAPPDLFEAPLSPTASKLPSMSPEPASSSRSASPPYLGSKPSLIDLKDSQLDEFLQEEKTRAHSAYQKQNGFAVKKPIANGTPLINLESPPRPSAMKTPPLPPRKPPELSSKSSLTTDHTYPPHPLTLDVKRGHAPASSISSFHSVSLSSDADTDLGTPGSLPDRSTDERTNNAVSPLPINQPNVTGTSNDTDSFTYGSLDGSFENLSSASASPVTAARISSQETLGNSPVPRLPLRPSAASSSTPSLNGQIKTPPRIPPRPSQPASSPGSPSHASLPPPSRPALLASASSQANGASRRPPPPPPSRSSVTSLASTTSDRSSVLSISSASSASTSLSSNYVVRKKPSIPRLQPTHINVSSPSPRASPIMATKSLPVQNLQSRPTPVPPAAQKRYERLFMTNILLQRELVRLGKLPVRHSRRPESSSNTLLSPTRGSRRAAGWRGLSVDLIVDPDAPAEPVPRNSDNNQAGFDSEDDIEVVESDGAGKARTGTTYSLNSRSISEAMREATQEVVRADEKLDGRLVRCIWMRSRLSRRKLKTIWSEVEEPGHPGKLSLDAFSKGMWKVDEELRKARQSLEKGYTGQYPYGTASVSD